jgi:tripartite-type tricarboxylate transporter receptor subunit TctC
MRKLLIAVALAVFGISNAIGQSYPTRPVRMIVAVAAGGSADVIARVIGQKLSERWGQTIYIENVPAGAGNLAVAMTLKAPPDGYTILVPVSNFVVNPGLYVNPPYDPITDLAPVSMIAASAHVLVVHPSFPAKTVGELIALVKANPGKFSYASPGAGTTGQMTGELFKLSLGLDLIHVPFNGAAPAVMSTIGGHTRIAFMALPSAAPNMIDGSLRALAVTSSHRSIAFPDVPTLAEAGFPGQESEFSQALLARAGTPKDIINLLRRELVRIVAMPDVKQWLSALSFEPVANAPEELGAWIQTEVARWAKVIHDAGIQKIE